MSELQVARVFDADDCGIPTTTTLRGDKTLLDTLEPGRTLACVPGFIEALRRSIREGRRTVLLTYEPDEAYQRKKLVRFGLDGIAGLEIIIVPTREGKRDWIKRIVEESGRPPKETVVIGDRLDQELLYGRESGCTLVRVKLPGGKYCHQECEAGHEPDLTIEDFTDPRFAVLV